MQSQFTGNAQEALKAAARCASTLKQGYVGSEHILAISALGSSAQILFIEIAVLANGNQCVHINLLHVEA